MSTFRPTIIIAVATVIIAACNTPVKDIPLVFDRENTAAGLPVPEMPGLSELPVETSLPDPFMFSDGRSRVKRYSQWESRRAEIMAELQHYEIGEKPVTPRECVKARMSGDTLIVDVTVNGETLTIHSFIRYPEGDGPFPAVIGIGMGAGSLPQHIFVERDVAMISFPFWEVMQHTQKRGEEPLNRLYPDNLEMGNYAAWPWGVSRLIDGLEIVGEASRIDLEHLAISGCSFAGKMALWSGAFDERIALTIAQEPGGGGAAAWRVSETLGNVETLGNTNFAWFKESMRQYSGDNVNRLPMDHHELCALVAPRALLVFGNPDYEWLADESGYVSCVAARKVWEEFGIADRMGYSFVAGHMHCMLPESQWPELEAFVDRFLLGKDVPTDVRIAPMFQDVDTSEWIRW